MKISSRLILIASLTALVQFGCSNAKHESESTRGQSEQISMPQPVTPDLSQYINDWSDFKTAYERKDVKGLQALISGDEIDAQNLLDMSSPEVVVAMGGTDYDLLKDSDYNGIRVKEFGYEETGYDDEGNEMGMALFFYFEEQEQGLRLIGYLAAG
ncbi:MAG: hypothetical protein H6581_10430 [Bacteroidia bacterium]|nr:hypothetical protein [Bacteroidia bacterium]